MMARSLVRSSIMKDNGNLPGEAVRIITVLGRPGAFAVLHAIEKGQEKAYLGALDDELKVSRGTIFARLKELEEVGMVMSTPQFDDSKKKLVLKYAITRKGYDILQSIASLPSREEKKITAAVASPMLG